MIPQNVTVPRIGFDQAKHFEGNTQKGVILVENEKAPELPPELLPEVEPGKTRLKSGSVINSIDRMFILAPLAENPKVFSFGGHDKVLYTRDANGSLRRLTPKKGKK